MNDTPGDITLSPYHYYDCPPHSSPHNINIYVYVRGHRENLHLRWMDIGILRPEQERTWLHTQSILHKTAFLGHWREAAESDDNPLPPLPNSACQGLRTFKGNLFAEPHLFGSKHHRQGCQLVGCAGDATAELLADLVALLEAIILN